MESISSKATVSYEVPVLVKPRFEEGSQKTLVSPRGDVLEEHSFYLKNTLLEKCVPKGMLRVRVFHKGLFIGKPLPLKCLKCSSL